MKRERESSDDIVVILSFISWLLDFGFVQIKKKKKIKSNFKNGNC